MCILIFHKERGGKGARVGSKGALGRMRAQPTCVLKALNIQKEEK